MKQEVPVKRTYKETSALARANGRDIVLFDGVCNLCNGAVDFILKRDPAGQFAFASLQSEAGQEVLSAYKLSTRDFNTVILVQEGKVYKKSRAALQIAGKLKGGWKLLQVFKIVPSFMGDAVYNFIARNRYRFFGKRETCRLPTPQIRSRFLEGL
jgi:predicted DCC family thiol-disulfide oxidoreductase YuxK